MRRVGVGWKDSVSMQAGDLSRWGEVLADDRLMVRHMNEVRRTDSGDQ
jgi:hypothetical protein